MLHGERTEEGELMFYGSYGSINDTLSKVFIEWDDPGQDCFAMKHWASKSYITLFSTECEAEWKIMCRSWPIYPIDCNSTEPARKKRSVDEALKSLDLMINPILRDDNQKAIAAKTKFYKEVFEQVI